MSGAGGKGKSAAGAGFGAAMAKMAKVGAVSLIGLGVAAVKMSNSFSTEMLKIRTEGGATSREFTTMRAAVIKLAESGGAMNQNVQQLALGLYHLESMGLRGRKALLALRLASEEAAISGSSLEDTTTAVGGAMYIALKGTGSVAKMMGTLNAIAGAGNMRFQQLNEALGTGLLSAAKVAGLSLQEVGSALAVLTDAGTPASSAAAQLATALHYLYAPTAKAETALKSIGLTHQKLAADLRKPQGLLAALQDLREHMKGLSRGQQADVLNSILPGGRGRVLLNLYELQNRLGPKYQQIGATSGDFNQHVAQQKRNPATRLGTALSELSGHMVDLGDALTKYVTPAVTLLLTAIGKGLGGLLAAFNWFTRMGPLAKSLATGVAILTAAFLAYRLGLLAAAAAQAILNGLVTVFWALATANPIGIVIVALAALAAGVVYAYNKFGWFRDGVNAVWKWLKGAVVDVVNWVGKHWKLLVSILGGPFVALGVFIATHFDAVKKVVVGILNWLIDRLNDVIGILNSLHISTPFGDIGVPHINPIGHVGAGNSTPSSGKPLPRNLNHSTPGHQGVAPGHNGPLIVHGDIVVRARENELGRVTRRQVQKAMAS